MRIAHLTTIDMSLALLLGTELREDVEEGHEVFAISAPGPYAERVAATGASFVGIPALTREWNLPRDARAFADLVRTLKRLRLDVLHTHTPKTGVMGRIAGRLAGIPVVVNTCHGLWAGPQDSLGKRAFVYGSEGFASLFCDHEFFQNASDAHTLRRVLRPERHSVVGNGIDLEHFRRDPAGRKRVRREWGVADGEILVGGVGRRVAEKGLAEFAAMATELTGRARFVWVGPQDGPTVEVDPASPITFTGERSDMRDVYSAFDVFVLPTYREGFSRAGMEAASIGLPLVLTDIRGCREIGTDEVHLLLVPPRDSAALTAAVKRLLGDAGLRARLGAAAEARAHADFDQRGVARTSLRTYAHILARKGAASGHRTVLHVIPYDSRRGAQVFAATLRDQLGALPEQRHLLLTLFAGPEAGSRPDVHLDCRSGLSRRLGFDAGAAWRLRRYLRRAQPDVIIAHGGEPMKYVVCAGSRAPVAYYKVGLSTDEISRPGRTGFYRRLVRRVDAAVGVSSAVAQQLRTQLGVPAERVEVIPNGRDPKVYHPRSGAGPAGSPLVFFVGQLEPGKRIGLFLDVIARLRADGLEFRAAVAGDGPERGSVEQRAADLGVELLGVCSDVPDRLRDAAVLLMTSAVDTEGMPGVVVEAGLSGIPVVSTRAAGVADVVLDGRTGLLGDDADQLAEHIARLLNSPEERARMGAAARERCVQEFSIENSARRWAALIERVAARPGPAAQATR